MLKQLFNTLTKQQRKQFYRLQIVNALVAIFEVAGVASVGPFVLLVANPDEILKNSWLHSAYLISNVNSPTEFLFIIALLAFMLLLLGTVFSIIATWKISLFSQTIAVGIGNELYRYYLQQSWLYHSSRNSSFFIKQISNETHRLALNIVSPIMDINAKIILISLMVSALLWVNTILVLIIIISLSLAYLIIYYGLRKRLAAHGKNVSNALSQRMQLLQEGFGGIKSVILSHSQPNFTTQFEQQGNVLSGSQAKVLAYSRIPRYIVEFMILSMILVALAYLISTYDNFNEVIAVLTIFSFAGLKLLPAFNLVYYNVANIKGNLSAFDAIHEDLKHYDSSNIIKNESPIQPIPIKKSIELKNIVFSYPNSQNNVINNLNITINAKKSVGIVGFSGSGKSTTIDLLLGLLTPQKGKLLIDGEDIIQSNNIAKWQANIGYVPQDIFLSDKSIKENIALGIPHEKINIKAVNQAIKLAHLTELIDSLPQGLDTLVGERGVQLSGGQRQRIGIARALYRKVELLVFDEATSSLDGVTERLIMEAIHDFSGKKTLVIIAHRIQTVKPCDVIYLLDNGEVIDQGNYDDLLKRNPQFQKMVNNA